MPRSFRVIRYKVDERDELNIGTVRRALSKALGLPEAVVNDTMVVNYALGVAADQITKAKPGLAR